MKPFSTSLVLVLGLVAACSAQSSGEGGAVDAAAPVDKPPPSDLVWPDAPPEGREALKGGVSEGNQQAFYHLGEGSELFPLTWILAVTQDNGEPFIKNLGRYGLIPDKKSAQNPAGLPIGLTTAPLRGMPDGTRFVGVNCAGCHVGEFESGGKLYVVDGAPNLLNVEQFFAETLSALGNTFKNPFKLWAFLKRTSDYSKALSEPVEPEEIDTVKAEDKKVRIGADDPRLRLETRRELDKVPDLESLQKGDDAEKALADEIIQQVKADEATLEGGLKAAIPREEDAKADVAKHMESIRKKAPNASPDRMKVMQSTFTDYYESARLFYYRLAFFWNRYRAFTKDNTPGGFGRTDAWGTVRSMQFDNQAPSKAPICYPFLWGFESDKYLHWISNTGSAMERNIGQAIGLTAVVDQGNYESTIDVRHLNDLELAAYEIKPPRWADSNLPPIDEKKRADGEKIFKRLCQDCHEKPKVERHEDKDWFDRPAMANTGTDPGAFEGFNKPVTVNGAATPLPTALHDLLGNVQKAAYAHAGVTADEAKRWEHGRAWIDPQWRPSKGYTSRPLAGIWATAPYLHNGSVPTLDALLRPSGAESAGPTRVASTSAPKVLRPKTFGIGLRTFDPVKVGYVDATEKAYLFDTSIAGNSNVGHEGPKYGTDVSEPDRASLIEYLKSL